MGAIFSTMRIVFRTMSTMMEGYDDVSKRISKSPGIPRLNSSIPYWTIPNSPIAQQGREAKLPDEADIIIIGSGITGTSIAKALLQYTTSNDCDRKPLRIVMLEARDACSGATGRNGGHASPIIYNEYAELKKSYGYDTAVEILRFRLAHITGLIAAAKEENVLNESQARIVDDFDTFLHPEMFERSKKQLKTFLNEVPKDVAETFDIIEERDDINYLQLSDSIKGLIVKPGASIHAYRFVTGILSNLLDRFSNFELYTHTPCTDIIINNGVYVVSTSKGKIRANHVVHATNAWSSHLLPGLRRRIVPVRAHMSAQRPGQGLSLKGDFPTQWTGSRAFVFYPGTEELGYDYLTQLLPSSQAQPIKSHATPLNSLPLPTAGEFMFGGGAMLGGKSEAALMSVLGVADDEGSDFEVGAYLCGALERYFWNNWGLEGNEPDTEASNPSGGEWGKGRVKALWTGIVALSADAVPWVGRVPETVSGRHEPSPKTILVEGKSSINTDPVTVPPGEWICAGYSGEGMVHAWLCGRAVARMILGIEDERDPKVPAPFLITEKRVRKAKIEDILGCLGN